MTARLPDGKATAAALRSEPADRVAYPSPQDPAYATALRAQAKDLLANPSHPVFDLVDRSRLHELAHRTDSVSGQAGRRGLERALDLAPWLEMYRPELSLS
ncbi:hypothetical protein [Streptomyces acidiscabies]|uniref:hypothetical protein n=1 Tax=Streptomyces acidiscabies TaxID=42234 RepID=UPI0038F60C60